MPDPSHRPYRPMTIIRPHSMPRFWWLCPWAYARVLHMSANALKAYADQADRCVEMQIRIIEDKSHDIELLKRRIADLEDSVIRGNAIVPDARPYHAASERLQYEAGKSGMSFEYTRNEDGTFSAEAPHNPFPNV